MLASSGRPSFITAARLSSGSTAALPEKLWQHLQTESDFPHEIGLFLGYPPEDVQGFIEQKACNSKCTGYWKVYGDQKKAERIFDRYNKCTACFLANWQRGVSLEQLTVKKV